MSTEKIVIRKIDGEYAAVREISGTVITESNGEPVVIKFENGEPYAARAHSGIALNEDYEGRFLYQGKHPETVRVVDGTLASGFRIINASDFDDQTMTLYTD
jgi:hypothetical protein